MYFYYLSSCMQLKDVTKNKKKKEDSDIAQSSTGSSKNTERQNGLLSIESMVL